VPWCDKCAEYRAPKDCNKDGSCPGCGAVLGTQGALRAEARSLGLPGPGEVEGEAPKVPWHFKLLMVALVLYLGWRLVDGIQWVLSR
jgi:hypothetical protein